MGIVEGGAENLAARKVLEGRRNSPANVHGRGVDWLAGAEARQRRAERAQQEDRLDQVAARLLDRERGQLAIVERTLGHHPVDCERELS